ncbi:GAF and ANTAR domain-containing protein [Arthrobacter parietis]|uniref:GAF and ANTAR domain-containing protein n=1 Tax=Arthrobacter parietis TaxID=271434 RepID=A0ABN3APC4_9MICC
MAPDRDISDSEKLQALLLESPGFTEFLLGLSTISASLFNQDVPMHCAITVERDGGPTTVASSSALAQRLDEQQYAFDDGPCLTALRTGHTVFIPRLADDPRWRRYAHAISGEQIRSVLAVPIVTNGSSAAALNCYSRDLAGFDAAMIASVKEHAASISTILQLALRVHEPEHYPDDLSDVLKSRAVVDAAVALVMAQNRCSREAAMLMLHVAARHHDGRVQAVAQELLGTARARTVISRTANQPG